MEQKKIYRKMNEPTKRKKQFARQRVILKENAWKKAEKCILPKKNCTDLSPFPIKDQNNRPLSISLIFLPSSFTFSLRVRNLSGKR